MVSAPLIFWGLFPSAYFLLLLWASVKYLFKLTGKEPFEFYFSQFSFCLICWLVELIFVTSKFYGELVDIYVLTLLPRNLIAWISYPTILFGLSVFTSTFQKTIKDPRIRKFS